jgi:hypothetical protein
MLNIYHMEKPWQPTLSSSMKSHIRSIPEMVGAFACNGAATSMTIERNRKPVTGSSGAALTDLFNLPAARRVSRHSSTQIS